MKKPKLVLFDIGGVLINYSNVFETVSAEQDIPRKIVDNSFDKYHDEITKGFLSPNELYLKCIEENELDADREYDFFNSWLNDFVCIDSTHNFLHKISANYDIGLFSNIYRDMIPVMKRNNQIPNVDYVHEFLSYELGMQKPDVEMFEYVQREVSLSSEEILFIDNQKRNTQVADSLGWNTFIFQTDNPEGSLKILSEML